RHGLNTDASFRYERGVDPNNTMYVLKLAAILVKQLAGGEICGEPIDIYPNVVEPAKVDLSYDYLNRLIGKDIPQETVDSILKSLEIEIKGKSGDVVSLEIPTYRVDVTRPCDVVEEVLRFYGYNNVEIASDVNSSLSYKPQLMLLTIFAVSFQNSSLLPALTRFLITRSLPKNIMKDSKFIP
ncbi:MAG: hypothetical protein K2O43_05200, partial [Muribaculaceae bacterium]|nr:hypothetical protein [Muribaculaceae bacterium]